MREIAGYIVLNSNMSDTPLYLSVDGVLYIGSKITLFKDRKSARLAVRRTIRYAKQKGYMNSVETVWGKYSIRKLSNVPSSKPPVTRPAPKRAQARGATKA